MVAWVVCACCSGGRARRQQYRYEVVYRREESLYSGPDYLESLPGRPQPPTLDTLSRQNRVNHFLTSLHHQPGHHPPPHAHPRPYSPRGALPPWRSAAHIQASQRPTSLAQSRSVPLLALTQSGGPPPVHVRDPSQSSRDLSRDTSRDISVASSGAHSSRPLLPPSGGRGGRPRPPPLCTVPLNQTSPLSRPPHSPHTPLSPGPPGYPQALPFSPLHNLSGGK